MTPLRFARWAAVSSKSQARPEKFSIPSQLEQALQAATARGWVETAGPFVVEGRSREIYIDLGDAERAIPELRHMLQAARRGEFDVLVLTEADRFRSILVALLRRLARYHVQMFVLSIPIDPVAPAEYSLYRADHVLMMFSMAQTASSLEIARTRRKWFESMPKRITEQGLPATSIPYGYRKPIGRELDRKAIPEPDPVLSAHVIRMKDLLLTGHSIRQISGELEKAKISPPRSKRWYPQTVREILRNPFYAGQVRFGVSQVYIDPISDKRKRNRRPAADRIRQNDGKHQPLWDMDTHRMILAELRRRATNYRGRSNNQFTGLLKCGGCGLPLWRQGNGPRGLDGAHQSIWRCSGNGSAKGHMDVLHSVLLEKVARALQRLKFPAEKDPAKAALADRSGQLAALESQLTRLEDAYLAGQWDLARYSDRKARLDAQIAVIQEEQMSAELQAAARRQAAQSLKELTTLPDLARWLKASDPAEVNQRLHLLIEKIVVGEERIEIVLK